ncbi:hypothetical protein NDU88_001705 [Pleurodeles waltl]|uniref:Uncharacterized protein n=1 Tax=Pleurodeles waltl TaxID=8319 RepID=A0AAV7U7L5_PLEWA|nr:hypothetical protein NDU88_001705 [Pleurodeles waltl]
MLTACLLICFYDVGLCERQTFEEADYETYLSQDELGHNLEDDLVEALDASVKHSINKTLAAVEKPITAQLEYYDKHHGSSDWTPAPAVTEYRHHKFFKNVDKKVRSRLRGLCTRKRRRVKGPESPSEGGSGRLVRD